jgi:hypothetical protein
LGNPQTPVRRIFNAVVQDGLFDLLVNPVGMRPSGAREAIHKALGTIDLVVSSDLVKLLA